MPQVSNRRSNNKCYHSLHQRTTYSQIIPLNSSLFIELWYIWCPGLLLWVIRLLKRWDAPTELDGRGTAFSSLFWLGFYQTERLQTSAEQTTHWLCDGSVGHRVCHFERDLFYIENGAQEISEHVRPKQAKLVQPFLLWSATSQPVFMSSQDADIHA